MGKVYDEIMQELYSIRREVKRKTAHLSKEPKLSVWYGYEGECAIKQDPEFFQAFAPCLVGPDGHKEPRLTLMGFTWKRDPGLPYKALTVHVDGKPYTTLSIEP